MKWKVVSTHFGKLENALNRLNEEGFAIWNLVILASESTRTKRFVVIIIARAAARETSELSAPSQVTEADETSSLQGREMTEESDLEIVTFFSDDQRDEVLKREKNNSSTATYRSDPGQGKLINQTFRPSRRTGRFDIQEPIK
jgi:hypothetical protein